MRTLIVGLVLAACIAVVAKAEHIGTDVQVGDTAAPLMICRDLQVAAGFYNAAIKGEDLSEDLLNQLQVKCIQGVMLKDEIKYSLVVAQIITSYINGTNDHVYLVRFAPYEGIVTWGVTVDALLVKRGESNGRRTHRR